MGGHTVGVHNLFGRFPGISDWPHAEGLGTPLDFGRKLGGLSEPARARIMRGNVAELVGL